MGPVDFSKLEFDGELVVRAYQGKVKPSHLNTVTRQVGGA